MSSKHKAEKLNFKLCCLFPTFQRLLSAFTVRVRCGGHTNDFWNVSCFFKSNTLTSFKKISQGSQAAGGISKHKFSSSPPLPPPWGVQSIVGLGFQYNLPSFRPVSSHCMQISYYLQILFSFISPSFLWPSSFLCSIHSGIHYLFWHSFNIHPYIMSIPS